MAELTLREAAALKLRSQGLSGPLIAERLGLNPDSVRGVISRAKAKLRQQEDQNGRAG